MELKIKPMKDLKAEMISVARGEQQVPRDAGQITFESIEAVASFLTPENQQLLAITEETKPVSEDELAHMVARTRQ
jgi:predicted transcriptional regulator